MTDCLLGAAAESIEIATVVNELDAAYEAIPEAERETWLERARKALDAADVPDWRQIAPVVKEAALTLWIGGV